MIKTEHAPQLEPLWVAESNLSRLLQSDCQVSRYVDLTPLDNFPPNLSDRYQDTTAHHFSREEVIYLAQILDTHGIGNHLPFRLGSCVDLRDLHFRQTKWLEVRLTPDEIYKIYGSIDCSTGEYKSQRWVKNIKAITQILRNRQLLEEIPHWPVNVGSLIMPEKS
jgi:hypothetical protein